MNINNDTDAQGFGLMGNDMSLVSKNNDTKMSDSEAFQAYMSKCEYGEDDDDEWNGILIDYQNVIIIIANRQ